MIKRKLTDEAIEALRAAYKERERIEWIALDVFRVRYGRTTADGTLIIFSKRFQLKEMK